MTRFAVWFWSENYERLQWFCFVQGTSDDAVYIAKRVRSVFGKPAVVMPYFWEPY